MVLEVYSDLETENFLPAASCCNQIVLLPKRCLEAGSDVKPSKFLPAAGSDDQTFKIECKKSQRAER